LLSRDLAGRLFADGNLASSFEHFENDHACNMFCKFYDLPRDFLKPKAPVRAQFGASFERILEDDELDKGLGMAEILDATGKGKEKDDGPGEQVVDMSLSRASVL
jgi:hypothetical protein